MLDFMIIALPRSGTTWASNLFTTDKSLCWHDPLYHTHYSEWDNTLPIEGFKTGISCTGIWHWFDFIQSHPAKKLILHRDIQEITKSILDIGMPMQDFSNADILDKIHGYHIPHSDLFDSNKCSKAWKYLLPTIPFNKDRHQLLVDIEMQPKFSGLKVGKEVTRKLIEELSHMG